MSIYGEPLLTGAEAETASGPIVSVNDALAAPLRSLVANIEPVQDLHGYDNPWPAGGGVNKFAIGDAVGLAVKSACYNLDVDIDAVNETIRIHGTPSWTASGSYSFRVIATVAGYWGTTPVDHDYTGYNAFTEIVSKSSNITGNPYLSVSSFATISIGALTVSDTNAVDITLRLSLNPTSTPTEWTPYSNICPISGWSAVNVWRTGKNLLNIDRTEGTPVPNTLGSDTSPRVFDTTKYYRGTRYDNYYYANYVIATVENGVVSVTNTNNNTYGIGFPVSVKGGQTYTLSFFAEKWGSCSAAYYDEAWEYLSGNNNLYGSQVTFTVPDNAAYAVITFRSAVNATNTYSNIQLELGSTATAYEPYSGDTYTIQLGQTVYGGTLDVTNGVLTVDRVADTFTKDSVWYGFATGTGNSSAVVQLSMYQNCKYVDGPASYNESISSTGVEAPNYWIGPRQNEVPTQRDMCFAYSQTGQLRFHRLDVSNITDLESFKAAFPDTVVCYYLATPITIPLTPTEISTLQGENNVWADSEDNTMEYLRRSLTYIS